MSQCIAITKSTKLQCKKQAIKDSEYCGIHKKSEDVETKSEEKVEIVENKNRHHFSILKR